MLKKTKKIRVISYKSNIVRFKWLLKVKKLRYKIMVAILLGIVNSLITTILIKNTTLYAGGTSAFFNGIGRLVRTTLSIAWGHANGSAGISLSASANSSINVIYNAIFWGGYLLMNIPLFILAYKKIGKNFAIISFVFVVSDRCSGFLWGLLGDNFTFDIFGSTSGINTYVTNNYKLDVVSFFPNLFPTGNGSIDWTQPWTNNPSAADASTYNIVMSGNYTRGIALLFYAIIYSVFVGLCVSILLTLGASSGGSDFISVYYSVKTHSEVGKIYTFVNGMFLLFGYILGSYVSGIMIWSDISKYNQPLVAQVTGGNQFANANNFFSANLLISLVLLLLNGIVIAKMFPSKKLIRSEISSDKKEEIDAKLFQQDIKNPIIPLKRAASHTTIKFICSYLDFIKQYNIIKEIDPNALIVSEFITDIEGPFDLYRNNFSD